MHHADLHKIMIHFQHESRKGHNCEYDQHNWAEVSSKNNKYIVSHMISLIEAYDQLRE